MMTWATSQETGHRKKSQTHNIFLGKFEASPPTFWVYFQITQSHKALNRILKDFKDLFMFILGFFQCVCIWTMCMQCLHGNPWDRGYRRLRADMWVSGTKTGSVFCWCTMSSSLLNCLASLGEWKLSKLQGKPLENPTMGGSMVKFTHHIREQGFHQRSEHWEKCTKKIVLELAHIIRN